ncbi:MAG: aminotransferase class V-fold PLP-dependent enzyme [Fimbriimonadia bacterium]
MNLEPVLLLGPGPSAMHPRVMEALASPMRGIFDPDLLAAMREISDGLRTLFGTSNRYTLCLPASGMSAMEAGIANLVEPGDRVVVCVNGFFSERIAHIAERYGAEVTRVEAPWGTPFEVERIEDACKQGASPKLLAIVLAETSTGGRNEIGGLGDVAHRLGALLMVDAVTALGGMPVEVDIQGVDYCYAGSQKCIGSPPGLAPITLSDRALEAISARRSGCPSFYLDVNLVAAYWLEGKPYHQTPSSPLIFALREALAIVQEEGLEARYARHVQIGNELRAALRDIGLQALPDPGVALPMLTVVRLPEGVEPKSVITKLRSEYHIEVGAALGEMATQHIRIGTMGYAASSENVRKVTEALRAALA